MTEEIHIEYSKDENCREEWAEMKKKHKMNRKMSNSNTMGGVYCLGAIGAAVYFIGSATTFWGGVLGFLKAIVWPAFFVYEFFLQVGA